MGVSLCNRSPSRLYPKLAHALPRSRYRAKDRRGRVAMALRTAGEMSSAHLNRSSLWGLFGATLSTDLRKKPSISNASCWILGSSDGDESRPEFVD